MKFEFVGTDDGPREIKIYGISFKKGEAVEVSADQVIIVPKTGRPNLEIKVIDKLKGNGSFKEVRQKAKAKPEKVEDVRESRASKVPESADKKDS